MRKPDYTCPLIDHAINAIQRAMKAPEDEIIYLLESAINDLEEIRKANEALREWGEYWQEYVEEEHKSMISHVEDMKSTFESFKRKYG